MILPPTPPGSRDATMVLWAIKEGDPPHCLAEKTTLFDPLFHFSNVRSLPSDCGERVRSLAFHKNSLVRSFRICSEFRAIKCTTVWSCVDTGAWISPNEPLWCCSALLGCLHISTGRRNTSAPRSLTQLHNLLHNHRSTATRCLFVLRMCV